MFLYIITGHCTVLCEYKNIRTIRSTLSSQEIVDLAYLRIFQGLEKIMPKLSVQKVAVDNGLFCVLAADK